MTFWTKWSAKEKHTFKQLNLHIPPLSHFREIFSGKHMRVAIAATVRIATSVTQTQSRKFIFTAGSAAADWNVDNVN